MLFRSNCGTEEAEEEFIADSADEFFTDEDSIKRLIKDERTVAEKFYDALCQVVDTLHTLTKGTKSTGEGKWMKDIGVFEKAQKMWTDALMNPETEKTKSSNEKYTVIDTEEGEVKFQKRKFSDGIATVNDNKLMASESVYMREVPKALYDIGFRYTSMFMSQDRKSVV